MPWSRKPELSRVEEDVLPLSAGALLRDRGAVGFGDLLQVRPVTAPHVLQSESYVDESPFSVQEEVRNGGDRVVTRFTVIPSGTRRDESTPQSASFVTRPTLLEPPSTRERGDVSVVSLSTASLRSEGSSDRVPSLVTPNTSPAALRRAGNASRKTSRIPSRARSASVTDLAGYAGTDVRAEAEEDTRRPASLPASLPSSPKSEDLEAAEAGDNFEHLPNNPYLQPRNIHFVGVLRNTLNRISRSTRNLMVSGD